MKKAVHRRTNRRRENLPLEFDRGWDELEAQHANLKSDWSSLAAQLGIGRAL
jgi:hypothetical protein